MLDINKLKFRDRITFGGEVTKIVSGVYIPCDRMRSVTFTDGTLLRFNDALWKLAELEEARPHEVLNSGFVTGGGEYQHSYDTNSYTPGTFLRRLKEDVAALEAAGVKADETN